MENKSKQNRKPPFIMWIIIGIGFGALIGGGLFHTFVVGAGVGVGFGVLLGLWAEQISKGMNRDK